MLGLEILDVAIGVIFVYVLVSILCTAIREGIEGLLKTRAAYLWLGVRELLHDPEVKGLANHFYRHPLIFSLFPHELPKDMTSMTTGLFAVGRGAPSYIPARNFAVALMDIAARGPVVMEGDLDITATSSAPVVSLENIRANVANIGNSYVQRVLLNAVDSAQGDLNRAQANIEAWYNSAMDRVSGWYKRTTQLWLFLIGLFVAVTMNINTLTIVDYLYTHPAARAAIVKEAEALLEEKKKDPQKEWEYKAAKDRLQRLELPVGWDETRFATCSELRNPEMWGTYVVVPLFGWLLTAIAAMLGAPFWFDVLNKVMVIRATVKPHEKSQEEGSEDRQAKTPVIPAPVPPAVGPPPPIPAPPQTPPAPQQTLAERVASDVESDIDACDVQDMGDTQDSALPQPDSNDGGRQ